MTYAEDKAAEDIGATEIPSTANGKSTLISRNITVMGRRTSVRLEPEMWSVLREISKRENCKIHDICSLIHLRKNPDTSLTAAIRVFVMLYYRAAATEEGHLRAEHGNFERMIARARVPLDRVLLKRRPQRKQLYPVFASVGDPGMKMNEMQVG